MTRYRAATILLLITCIFRCIRAQTNISSSGEFVRFTLFEGGTTNVVTHLYNNTVVKIPQNSTPNFGLVALTTGGPITAVLFGYNNITTFRREKSAPYCLCGNRDIRIDRCSVLGIGTHQVNATITNTKRSYIVTFQILYDASNGIPTKSPYPPPTNATNHPVRPQTIAPVLQGPIKSAPAPSIVPPVPQKFPSIPPIATNSPIKPMAPAPVNAPTPGRTNFMTFALIFTGDNTIAAQLVNGMVVDASTYPSSNFNVRVDTINSSIKSVLFLQNNQVEVSKPWAYCGNAGEIYNSCSEFSKEGTFTVTARLYSDANPQRTVVSDESITFTIVGKPSFIPLIDKFPILINAGGPTTIDIENQTWVADSYFVGGSTYSNSQVDIVNSDNDAIYQSERYGNFVYEIPIPRASYSVILHFAEI
jgi:hypothetical protein